MLNVSFPKSSNCIELFEVTFENRFVVLLTYTMCSKLVIANHFFISNFFMIQFLAFNFNSVDTI